jgi:geranylgeranyl reductase family protein
VTPDLLRRSQPRNGKVDVIVVGAGPAGSLASLLLARAGARVLLLEKGRVGRDKPCGGGLTARAWQGLEVCLDGLVRASTQSAELRWGPGLRVTVNLGSAPVWFVLRRELDRRLTEAAGDAGVEVHTEEPALDVQTLRSSVRVRTHRDGYEAAAVLIATGAEGALRRAAQLPEPRTIMVPAIEMEGPLAHPGGLDGARFVFDYSVPGGYAWAFPKDDWCNVGILSTDPRVARELRSRLASFVAQIGVRFDSAERAAGRRIPMYIGTAPLSQGRAALLGDAAGLADAFFGEGIAQAFASARQAARTTGSLLAGECDGLEDYSVSMHRLAGPHLRRMRWLAQATYSAPQLSLHLIQRLAPARRIATHLATEPLGRH